MSKLDRLSTLISRFSLTVEPSDPHHAHLIVFSHGGNGNLTHILFSPAQLIDMEDMGAYGALVFCAQVEWGGASNPLITALPAQMALDIDTDMDTSSLVHLLMAESKASRCGSGAVLNRLGEVLVVRLLRKQLEQGTSDPGLLGGLADKRLSRAIVAMHDNPETNWRNEDLADIAGLSMSRFYELFKQVVGVTPIAYLRSWRMILARQDIERGDRIQVVAKRYCYGSTEALNRSFTKEFGHNPMFHRKKRI